MTTEFSIIRLKDLIIRQFIMNKKFLRGFLLGGFIGPFIATVGTRGLTLYSFWVIFKFLCILFAGIFPFISYKNKRSRVLEITLPATQFEKYLSNFLFAFIAGPIIAFVATYLAIFLGCRFSILMFHPVQYVPFDAQYMLSYKFSFDAPFVLSYLLYVVTMFFGAIYFKKQRIIKTNAFLIGYIVLLATIYAVIFYNGAKLGVPALNIKLAIYSISKLTFCIGIGIAIIFVLWLTYQRLKEERV